MKNLLLLIFLSGIVISCQEIETLEPPRYSQSQNLIFDSSLDLDIETSEGELKFPVFKVPANAPQLFKIAVF
ncbi:MAG: hypothetical protein AAF135_20860, partial [Bacteroidota bacterium]